MRDSNILESLAIMIIYEISFDEKFNSFAKNLYNLFCYIYQNFLLVCGYYTNKFSTGNILLNKLKSIINEKLNMNLKKGENKILIRKNNNNVFNSIRDIIE